MLSTHRKPVQFSTSVRPHDDLKAALFDASGRLDTLHNDTGLHVHNPPQIPPSTIAVRVSVTVWLSRWRSG